MIDPAAAWTETILQRLPRSVRGRYLARLVRRAYGLPRPVVLAGMAVLILCYILLGVAAVAGIVDALCPWGPWAWLMEEIPAFVPLAFVAVPAIGSCALAWASYRRLRLRLLRGELQPLAEGARLRTCPGCAYEQRGTPGARCPECGCPVAFSGADLAGAGAAGPGAERARRGIWRALCAVVLPGAAAGLAGLLAFGAAHAAIISPIWSRLAGGWPMALLGGIALAWAFHALQGAGALRGRFADALRLGALLWVGLLPMNAFGLLVDVLALEQALGRWEVPIEVALAIASGAVLGWLLARRRAAAVALGAATLALGLASGGPAALTTLGGAAILAWMLPIFALACLPLFAVRRAAAPA
jgi:hypothetical protein